ncbi:MAG: class I SAM-dependent methyltransferase [Patescibacteria group bacterium]|nr:class I SAM-dependent methyltransferase [Patescibacteria group bacterium]
MIDLYKDKKIKRKEKKFWHKYNKLYHNYERGVIYRDFLRDFESFISPKSNEVWLDAGCGIGGIINLIKKKSKNKVKKIIGVDADKNVLFLARQKFQQDIQRNIVEFLNISISQKTIFRNEEFDGVVANFVFPYIIVFDGQYADNMAIEMVMREMHRILKRNGIIVWSTLNKNFSLIKLFWNSKKDFFYSLENAYYTLRLFKYLLQIKGKNKRGIYHSLSKDEIDPILKKIGFRNIVYKKSLVNQALIIKAEK